MGYMQSYTNLFECKSSLQFHRNIELGSLYGGFLKWWYPTTMGFPTKKDHFGVFWGYHYLRKHPYSSFLLGKNCHVSTFPVFGGKKNISHVQQGGNPSEPLVSKTKHRAEILVARRGFIYFEKTCLKKLKHTASAKLRTTGCC